MMRMATKGWLFLLFALLPGLAWAQTGKIAGTVTDAASGEPLPGVNVIIDGTVQGTVTDADGYYVILNVKPGTYALRASFVGFTPQLVQGVRVNIDQTTTIDIRLQEQIIEGGEVVVTAVRPVVQADVSNSQANITSEQVQSLPVASVTGVVGLQAGVQGLSVRGSDADEVSFMVNGLTLRDERNNSAFTSIPLVSVEEVQVQTGGFNAEYGNVRSGVINVVTKEGDRNRYGADVVYRHSPPARKHFEGSPNDPNSYWIRPFIDPEVAFTGTENGAWGEAVKSQYPAFEGWNAVAQKLLEDDDPANDMTPEALRQAFLWQHRKSFEITQPDYTLDVGFGGPVPGGAALGDLRFYGAYRRVQDMYFIPLSRDRYVEETGHLKMTSDLKRGMKLTVEGMYGQITGTAASTDGSTGLFRSASGIAGNMNRVSFIDTRLFAYDYWAPTTIDNFMLGAKFTHALGNRTFYELRATRFASKYDTNPGALRDSSAQVVIGGVPFDEAPYGFTTEPTFGVNGMRMSVGMSTARDTSRVTVYNFKGDLTSQLNRYLQVKTGFEYNLTNSNARYGRFDQYLPANNTINIWDRTPVRGALYGQSKLEFQGMVANLGLRLDYAHAGGTWYDYDAFTDAFARANNQAALDTLLETVPTERLFTLSPRLGVSFPVTELSKLYFNYGHFRQMPDPDNLYLVRFFGPSQRVSRIANPNNPLPKTVAYELGFEQSLLNQFLVKVAGYYKDVSLQPYLVEYFSRNGQVEYTRSEPLSYEDIRGFEFTFARTRGRWLQGFVNYTYMVQSFGFFGADEVYENQTRQRNYDNNDAVRRAALSRPVPQPYARLNLDLLVPDDFGPSAGGLSLLGSWRVSLLGRWQAGSRFTWTGGGSIPGVRNNVQFRDYWDWELRLKRNFDVAGTRFQVFADVYNLFNQKRLSFNGFVDGNDYNAYMRSLHLPADPNYPNIPGKDRPGDYRPSDVAYVPMTGIQDRTAVNRPSSETIYYEFATQQYLQYRDGAWQTASQQLVDEVLKDKAYIDNPNMDFFTFLNPRDVYFGIRLSF